MKMKPGRALETKVLAALGLRVRVTAVLRDGEYIGPWFSCITDEDGHIIATVSGTAADNPTKIAAHLLVDQFNENRSKATEPLSLHDRVRLERALACDRDNLDSVSDAVRGLQSTDHPLLVPLYDELFAIREQLKNKSVELHEVCIEEGCPNAGRHFKHS